MTSPTPDSSTAAAPTARPRRTRWQLLVKEVGAFGVVGGINFLVDLGLYQMMYAHLGAGALVSKVISTVVTSSLAYFLHRHWSFSHRARSGLRREFVAFLLLSGMSLLLGLLLIGGVRYGLGRTDLPALQSANVASIVLGAVFRFFAYKQWVFLREDDTQPSPGRARR